MATDMAGPKELLGTVGGWEGQARCVGGHKTLRKLRPIDLGTDPRLCQKGDAASGTFFPGPFPTRLSPQTPGTKLAERPECFHLPISRLTLSLYCTHCRMDSTPNTCTYPVVVSQGLPRQIWASKDCFNLPAYSIKWKSSMPIASVAGDGSYTHIGNSLHTLTLQSLKISTVLPQANESAGPVIDWRSSISYSSLVRRWGVRSSGHVATSSHRSLVLARCFHTPIISGWFDRITFASCSRSPMTIAQVVGRYRWLRVRAYCRIACNTDWSAFALSMYANLRMCRSKNVSDDQSSGHLIERSRASDRRFYTCSGGCDEVVVHFDTRAHSWRFDLTVTTTSSRR